MKRFVAFSAAALVIAALAPTTSVAQPRSASPYASRRLNIPFKLKSARMDGVSTAVRRLPTSRLMTVPARPTRSTAQAATRNATSAQSATLSASWDGISSILSNNKGVNPPDTNGDVGKSQYVQIVNSPRGAAFAVYDKAQGGLLAGPTELSDLWSSGYCNTHAEGDPIAQYDQYADRWILAQFAFGIDPSNGNPTAPFDECVAVSTTGDPTGVYNLYDFPISNTFFPDFPKFGVWPGSSDGSNNGYYMTVHLFDPNAGYVAQGIIVLDRANMLLGQSARAFQGFASNTNALFGAMPADAQSSLAPPDGTPEFLAAVKDGAISGGPDRIDLYGLFVDWDRPSNTFAGGPLSVGVSSFDANLCNGGPCIPQKGVTSQDNLNPVTTTPAGTPLSYPLAYRNFGNFDSLALADTVDVGGDRAGVRWYELQQPGSRPEIARQGTIGTTSDDVHRFMGSIAMDKGDELGLGYSVSGTNLFPGIRYTGPLTVGSDGATSESTLMDGGGSQLAGGNRWGDYSSMSVDPVDQCTFYYTNEYYTTTIQGGHWNTRIGSFKFPTCESATPSSPGPDTTPPRVQNAFASPVTFTPLARKHKVTFINWESSEKALPTVKITSKATGKLVARFTGGGTYELPFEQWSAKWNGKVGSRVLPAGAYRYSISLVDEAGNPGPPVKGTVFLKR
ncbi:MAG: large repetitive protein [Actinomycetota bacterium]|nr:large repetitive protein [Actinomycetota bacterium]